MSSDFSLSAYLSPEAKERLDRSAQCIGIQRDRIVEYAVEKLLEDLSFDAPGEVSRPSNSAPE